jgi:hypothetical protein
MTPYAKVIIVFKKHFETMIKTRKGNWIETKYRLCPERFSFSAYRKAKRTIPIIKILINSDTSYQT